jgi:serine/threonine protein kinase
MNNDTHHDPSDGDFDQAALADDPRVLEVIEEYSQALERGELIDRQKYLSRYPELASTIASCLDALELVHSGVTGESSRISYATPLPPTASPGPIPRALGDFQIVRELARGGMGIVYEALQLSLGRRVALKVLPFAATFDERTLQRFKNEAQAAALLHHTHIVPIYAVGCERGVHFYAMQLIEGQSLAVVIKQLRAKEGRATEPDKGTGEPTEAYDKFEPPPAPANSGASQSLRSTIDVSATMVSGGSRLNEAYVRRAAKLMVQAAEALEHAHQEGIVHRDIKPANLLLDATGKLWITDFGLAQLQVDNGLTRSGDVLGTLRYMSPEQTSGQRTMLDQRTDIYSLGATFYELLTLEPVFDGVTHQELLYQILHTEPKSLREKNRAVPPELETIILKALSKLPAERYRSAADFAADIQRYLDNQPILARRPSVIDRTRKWMRRHPSVVAASAILLVVVTMLSLVNGRRLAAEQALTKKALEGEQQRSIEAEQRFQQARQAVDTLFTISEEELADRPNEPSRQRILEVVLSFYQDFIEQRAGDPQAQAELASVQAKVKNVLHDLELIERDRQTNLLGNVSVRKELQLSDEIGTKLAQLHEKWEQERRQLEKEGARADDRRAKLAEEHERIIEELLSPAQMQRLRQIHIQSQRLFAFKNPAVVKELGLTSQQRGQIREIERKLFAQRGPRFEGPDNRPHPNDIGFSGDAKPGESERPFRGPGRGGEGPREGSGPRGGQGRGPIFGQGPGRGRGPDKHWEEMENAMKSAIDEVLAILTPEQRETWDALVGAPFTGPFEGPGFGPGRPF